MSKSRLATFVFALTGSAAAFAQGTADSPTTSVARPATNEWTTWGYDEERTGWNRAETTLNKSNVSKLKVRWNTKLSTPVSDVVLSTLTAPVIAAGVGTAGGPKDMLFVLGSDDVLTAIDANTGARLWQKAFRNQIMARKGATWLCSNTANATPVIDKAKGVIYVLPSDGKLRGLSLADGAERLTPTEMVAPYARAWSLNLFDDVVYTTSGRACGEVQDPRSVMAAAVAPLPPRRRTAAPASGGAAAATATAPAAAPPAGPPVMTDASAVTAVDVRDPARPQVTHFFTSGGRPAGAWGRGGLARGPGNTLILETSDGLYDPAGGSFGDTILKLSPKAARVVDSFTPANHKYLFSKDLAGSASPVVFPFEDKTLVAVAQKEGVLYILDANNMGGGRDENHATAFYKSPQLGNDIAAGTDPGQGVWGAITTYRSPEGKRFLYVPMWGPPSKNAPVFKTSGGPAPNGSIMAFQVVKDGDKVSLIPAWTSPDMILPDPPSVANGVVFATDTGGQALQNPLNPDGTRISNATPQAARFRASPVRNMILYAFDAETGKQLYSSKKTIPGWVHFGEPVVALGKVFLVTHDARIYAFGLGK